MRELLQLLQVPAHLHHEVIELRLQILLYAVTEQLREPPKHHDRVPMREPDIPQVLDPRDELILDATR